MHPNRRGTLLRRGLRPRLTSLAGLLPLCLFVTVLVPLAIAQQPSSHAPSEGAVIFAQRCATCHGAHGEGIAAAVTIAGPSLRAEHDLGTIMTAVESGPSHMPSFSRILSAPQIHSVSYYVSTQLAVIPLMPGDLATGGRLFRQYCAACHRPTVRGGTLAFAGRNAPALTGKSAALIAGAIRWGPGAMPSFPESVLNDQELSSVVRYVRFVEHPPNPGGNPLKYEGPVLEGVAAGALVLVLIGATGWIEEGRRG